MQVEALLLVGLECVTLQTLAAEADLGRWLVASNVALAYLLDTKVAIEAAAGLILIYDRQSVHGRLVRRWRVRIALASLRVLTISHDVRLSRRAGKLLVLTVLEGAAATMRSLRQHLLVIYFEDAALRVPRVHGGRPTIVHSRDCHVVEVLTLIPGAAISSRNFTSHLAHARHGDHLIVRNTLFHLHVCDSVCRLAAVVLYFDFVRIIHVFYFWFVRLRVLRRVRLTCDRRDSRLNSLPIRKLFLATAPIRTRHQSRTRLLRITLLVIFGAANAR